MSEINVLYAFDTRFWRMAAVSIYSLMKNKAPDTIYNIYCMVPPHTHGRKKIENISKSFPGRGTFIWRTIKKSENPFQTYYFSRWSPVIFYRLFAHKIFPEIDKLLYLDSDTMILDDLSILYNTDISQYAAGAVIDMAPVMDTQNPNGQYVRFFSEKYLKNGPYFNSGVLLLNTKNMTKNEMLLKNTKVKLKYPDQDILNAALAGKIKPLELKYNLAPGIKIPKTFPKYQADDAKSAPAILHFYSGKPYNYETTPREIYALFYNTAIQIGMRPDDFIKQEKQHKRHHNHTDTKTNIPFLRIRKDKITLFGIISIQV